MQHSSPLGDVSRRFGIALRGSPVDFACPMATGGLRGSVGSVRRLYGSRGAGEFWGVDFWAKALRTTGAGARKRPTARRRDGGGGDAARDAADRIRILILIRVRLRLRPNPQNRPDPPGSSASPMRMPVRAQRPAAREDSAREVVPARPDVRSQRPRRTRAPSSTSTPSTGRRRTSRALTISWCSKSFPRSTIRRWPWLPGASGSRGFTKNRSK